MNDALKDRQIIHLLRDMRDLEGGGPMGSGSGSRDSDRLLYVDGGPWETSGCDLLDDALKLLRAERPVQWWHVTERYLRCEVRPRKIRLVRNHAGEFVLPKPGPHQWFLTDGTRFKDSALNELVVTTETWSPQVRLEKVRRGVGFLAVRFDWGGYRGERLTPALAA